MKNLTKKIIILTTLLFVSVVFATAETVQPALIAVNPDEAAFCTMDVKECSDGSFVGRQAPTCEFKACPATDATATPAADPVTDSCKVWFDGCNTCSRASADGPAMCTLMACLDTQEKAYCKEYFADEAEEPVQKPCTREYDPVCGLVDTGVRCITAPCPSAVKQTFSNECMAENAGATILHEASCETGEEHKLGNQENKNQLGEQPAQDQIIDALVAATSEQERKQILEEEKAKMVNADTGVAAAETNTGDQEKFFEKRKEVLDKKSEEIFSKYDFFIAEIQAVAEKIALKNQTVNSAEVTEILEQVTQQLTQANRLKTEAWVAFAEIADAETKEAAAEKIATVGELLVESKQHISGAFAGAKQSLEFLKK